MATSRTARKKAVEQILSSRSESESKSGQSELSGSESGAAIRCVDRSCFENEIDDSVRYLCSIEASESMRRDPYWPKWHSPWWHMTLLYEMGLTKRIPIDAINLLIDSLNNHCLHFFPFTEEEVPEGFDPIRSVLCHCALGTAQRVLIDFGIDVEQKMPWIGKWFSRYQLGDGGFNCDESAYTKKGGKSSMISTIHMIESLLALGSLNEDQITCLDKCVEYVLRRKLLYSISKGGQLMDPAWTELTFPRFYEYDVLRGLAAVLRTAVLRRRTIAFEAIEDGLQIVYSKLNSEKRLKVERQFFKNCTSLLYLNGAWVRKQPVTEFQLLLAAGADGRPSEYLTRSWWSVLDDLKTLNELDLLS